MNRELNPYAPPRDDGPLPVDPPRPHSGRPRERPDYREERRSLALCVFLTVVSCGFYPMIWVLLRRPFFNRLHRRDDMPLWAPAGACAVQVLAVVVGVLAGPDNPVRLVGYAGGALALFAVFRGKSILEADLLSRDRGRRLSGAATFFFGALYLQWVINREADRPPPEDEPPPPRRRKKRKKPRAEAPAAEPQA